MPLVVLCFLACAPDPTPSGPLHEPVRATVPAAPPSGACNDGEEDTAGGARADCRLEGTYGLEDADVVWLGEAVRGWCGVAVAGGADLDGDAVPDVAVGCSGASHDGVRGGVVYVFRGRPTRVDAPLAPASGVVQQVAHTDHARIVGQDLLGNLGFSLALGDVDGDGRADLVTGAPYEGPPEAAGAVWVVPGPLPEGVLVPGSAWSGTRVRGSLGQEVEIAGDLDGDGRVDLLAAEFGVADPGRVWLLPGAAGGAVRRPDHTALVGACGAGCVPEGTPGGATGAGLAVGDVDGDGTLEVLVGAPADDAGGTDAGVVYLHRAGDGERLADQRLVLGSPGDRLGNAVLLADVDADGWLDAVAGAPGADEGAGAIVIHFGPLGGGEASEEVRLAGGHPGAAWGTSLAWLGDVDGDGAGDLLVGAPDEDRDEMALRAGVAWLLYGPLARGGTLGPVARFAGIGGSRAGYVVEAAGDVNGDGLADLLVGAPATPGADGEPRGAAYLVYGRGG